MKYGEIWFAGKVVKAHRLSYEHYKGPIPDGMRVLHDCPGGDNSLCVNPDHLWLGTQADNMQDAATKGRMNVNRTRDQRPSTKVTDSQIEEILQLRLLGHTLKQIGDLYRVDASTIGKIIKQKGTQHVSR